LIKTLIWKFKHDMQSAQKCKIPILSLLTTGDKILILFFIITSWVGIYWIQRYQHQGEIAVIKLDGKMVATSSLKKNQSFKIMGPVGETRIEIKDSKIRVQTSDCPQKICVKTGWIDRPFQLIVCVPNKIVISIEGEKRDYFDVITQ